MPPLAGGELVTKPLTFSGRTLHLNFATSAAGAVRVEIQRPGGSPIEGFALDACDELFGDTIDRPVSWHAKTDVSTLVGQPVRLRFQLKDADLYALQFADD